MSRFFARKKSELGIDLNDVQKQAVLQTQGPLLLLACPGSGKTTTMIMRIGYLLEELEIHPKRIKAITFSRASAIDMRNRFTRLFPTQPLVDFSTIHSLAFMITRTYLKKNNISYELIEGQRETPQSVNKMFLLKRIYKDLLKEDCPDDELASLSTFISSLKNKMVPLDKWKDLKGPFEKAGKIAFRYEQFKRKEAHHLYLDFDDMLVYAEKGLRTDDALADDFRGKYDYVMTDESQDTSLVQHLIVEHLVAHHGNLCVVADDDQSIYTWRGADPNYLLDFRKVYPDATVLKMEHNYRSSKEIVETASKFIKRNTKRYPKEMYTKNGEVTPIQLKQLANPQRQLDYIIYELLAEENLNEVAVLFRNNASSTMYVSELHRRGIPFYMKDADDKIFSHWIVEDILNFMRLSFNTSRKDVFAKIVLKMNLFISRKMVTQFQNMDITGNVFDGFINSVDLNSRQKRKLEDFKKGYEVIPDMRPLRVIQLIRRDFGYDEALKSRSEKFGLRFDYLKTILDTLEAIATPYRTMIEFANQLKELEQAVQNAKASPQENAVTLSTFHSAKGLEFRRVFMIDLQKGVIPSDEDENDDEMLEEARRLFYVGMTRAKKRLELLSYKEDNGVQKYDSRFLNEVRHLLTKPVKETAEDTPMMKKKQNAAEVSLNPHGLKSREEIHEGLFIHHRVFGHGKINKIQENRVEIQFSKEAKVLDLETILQYRLLEQIER